MEPTPCITEVSLAGTDYIFSKENRNGSGRVLRYALSFEYSHRIAG
jgi:hypothetical protein